MNRLARRTVLASLGAAAAAACTRTATAARGDPVAALGALEARAGGRLGVSVVDSGSGATWGWRAGERFALCSTFKLSLAAMALSLADDGALALEESIAIRSADILGNSPAASARVGTGMTLRELAHAAQTLSDNTAANYLLARVGGPAALTRFWRSLGDADSRLDRTEPALNRVPPGDLRDTTTPRAMAHTVARLLFAGGLGTDSAATLRGWMRETLNTPRRLRAGLPPDWDVGDKPGTGTLDDGVAPCNDVAFAVPPGRAPLVIAAYYNAGPAPVDLARSEAVLADVGRLAAQAMEVE